MDIENIKKALTADDRSKAAYAGRVEQKEIVIVHTEDGTPIQREISVYISWDSIAEILAMVRKRCGFKP